MFDRHVRKTRFHFSAGAFLLIATLVSGITLFKEVPYFTYDYVVKQFGYVKYSLIAKIQDTHPSVSINQRTAKSIPVLVYHGIVEEDGASNGYEQFSEGLSVTQDTFFEQMAALKKDGWNTVSIHEANKFLSGSTSLPEKSFLLTFDDGRKDSFYKSDPILKVLDYRATMFVITARSLDPNLRRSFFLSKNDLQIAAKNGRWDIQSHGHLDHEVFVIGPDDMKGHFMSNKIWRAQDGRLESDSEYRDRILNDLKESKNQIENNIGSNVIGYAYPFSDYGNQESNHLDAEDVVLDLTKSVYPLAFYQVGSDRGAPFNYPFLSTEDFMVKRIKFSKQISGDELVRYLNSYIEKQLPYEESFSSENSKWSTDWGKLTFNNGSSLTLSATDHTTGAAGFLDGSQTWQDYAVDALVTKKQGDSASIVAYETPEGSYVCTLSDKYIKIQKQSMGETATLVEYRILQDIPFDSGIKISFGKNFRGELSCGVGDYLYVADGIILESADARGRVGIKVWNENLKIASLSITGLKVYNEGIKTDFFSVVDKSFIDRKKNSVATQEQSRIVVPDLSIPYTWNVHSNSPWVQNWGDIQLLSSGMVVAASPDTTGAMVLFESTNLWQNAVNLLFSINWESGSNVVLVYRYKNDNNYGSIVLHDDYIRIEEIKDGKKTVLSQKERNYADSDDKGFFKENLRITLSLAGPTISIRINNDKILTTSKSILDYQSGLTGIKVWDKDLGQSRVILESILVEKRQ